jgi:glycosyltransferase domain-containing protein
LQNLKGAILSILKEVSIVIPTKNRSSWCKRLLNYYANLDFPGKVIFCDSSDSDHYNKLNVHLKRNTNIDVVQLSLPDESVHFALQVGIEIASNYTKYFAQSGDDDFYSIEGLASAAKFLSADSDYVSCIGKSVIAGYSTLENQFDQLWVRMYGSPRSLTQNDPNKRVLQITSQYYNLEFSLRRTNSGLNVIRNVNNFLGSLPFEESTTAEYCSVIGIAYSGKVKVIAKPFLLRVDHSARPNRIRLDPDKIMRSKVLQLETARRFHLHLQNPEMQGLVNPDYLHAHYEELKYKTQYQTQRLNSPWLRIYNLFVRVKGLILGNFSKIAFQNYYRQYERAL